MKNQNRVHIKGGKNSAVPQSETAPQSAPKNLPPLSEKATHAEAKLFGCGAIGLFNIVKDLNGSELEQLACVHDRYATLLHGLGAWNNPVPLPYSKN